MLCCNRIETGSQSADKVGVRKKPTQAGLAVEAIDELAGMCKVVCKKFDRNRMPSCDIVAEVNSAHPAFPNTAEKPITSDLTKVGVYFAQLRRRTDATRIAQFHGRFALS
jgi:hypothetical protein